MASWTVANERRVIGTPVVQSRELVFGSMCMQRVVTNCSVTLHMSLVCLNCWGGNLEPLPADKSDWHIHQFVRVHIPWHIHQT